eukprot:Transcript_26020.p3 GENE.Transcript_26020~~Transcript_26020.p3  ORF type:complete len:299 (-),score=104.60 Transcript_26020:1045-1941(-)
MEELAQLLSSPCCDEVPHACFPLRHAGGGGSGGAARLSLLGAASGPQGGRSLAAQDGVLARMGALSALSLTAWTAPEPAEAAAAEEWPGLPKEKAAAAGPAPLALARALEGVRGAAVAAAGGAAARGSSPTRRPLTLEAMVGLEYECVDGHRFVAQPGTGQLRPAADAPTAPLESALAEETPLTRACAAEGCTHSAQLLRLHVRSPEAQQQLVLRPRVCFLAGGGGKGAAEAAEVFAPDAPLLLPAASAVCLRLPLIFEAGTPLLTAATVAEPRNARKAVLLPHWLCTPETAAQLDAV